MFSGGETAAQNCTRPCRRRRKNPAVSRYANRIVERILQYSEDKNMENLSYIIALVRRVCTVIFCRPAQAGTHANPTRHRPNRPCDSRAIH